MAHIFAHITVTRVKWEASITELAELEKVTAEALREQWQGDSDYYPETDTVRLEDALEEHGWVDRSWSPYVLHESRNDVRPEVDADESDPELADYVREALGWLEGGYEDNGDGTFYASESYQPHDQPWSYGYALHFVRKDQGPKGWYEKSWTPPAEMRP